MRLYFQKRRPQKTSFSRALPFEMDAGCVIPLFGIVVLVLLLTFPRAAFAEGGLTGVVSGVTEPTAETLGAATEPVGRTVETVSEPAAQPVEQAVGGATEPLVQGTSGAVQPVTQTLSEPVESVTQPMDPVTQAAGQTVGTVVEPVGQVAQPALKPVSDTTREVVAPAVEPVLNPVKDIVTNVVSPVVEPVADGVEPILKPVQVVAAPVVEGTRPVTEPVLEPVEELVEVPVEEALPDSPVTPPVTDSPPSSSTPPTGTEPEKGEPPVLKTEESVALSPDLIQAGDSFEPVASEVAPVAAGNGLVAIATFGDGSQTTVGSSVNRGVGVAVPIEPTGEITPYAAAGFHYPTRLFDAPDGPILPTAGAGDIGSVSGYVPTNAPSSQAPAGTTMSGNGQFSGGYVLFALAVPLLFFGSRVVWNSEESILRVCLWRLVPERPG